MNEQIMKTKNRMDDTGVGVPFRSPPFPITDLNRGIGEVMRTDEDLIGYVLNQHDGDKIDDIYPDKQATHPARNLAMPDKSQQ